MRRRGRIKKVYASEPHIYFALASAFTIVGHSFIAAFVTHSDALALTAAWKGTTKPVDLCGLTK